MAQKYVVFRRLKGDRPQELGAPLFACQVIVAKFRTRIDVLSGSERRGLRQTLIYTANRSQWRSVEGDRAFKLVEVSRLRSSSNTLPRLGYAAVNCSVDASAATAIDQSSLRSRIHGVPETVDVSFRPWISIDFQPDFCQNSLIPKF